jgi:hypothetical protein
MFSQTFIVLFIDNIATFLGQVALILMKKTTNDASKGHGLKWLCGLMLVIVSSLVHVAVLPYADLVLLSSSSATAIIFGIVLSVYMLGEKFDMKHDLPGVLLTCTGCILTVMNANTVEQNYTLDELKNLLLTPKAALYIFLTFLNIAASMVCIFKLE